MRLPRRASLAAALAILACGCGTEAAGSGGEPASAVPARSPYDEATRNGGDSAPHQGENNAWKNRAPLSAEDERLGRAAEAKVRPALSRLRERHDFAVTSVERTLLGLGYARDRVQVQSFRTGASGTAPAPGVVFVVLVGTRACVHGDIRPSRLLIEVEGTTREGTCLEPFTH
ncbi:hypothetical protein [Spirillospora albida]|uniref:hypothetical protein n=1 Tax=Spirillospora albida TaxID=58123 RepID=UPI0004C08F02|nr:hypothetical protein [Spirillospora albida]